ncbi:PPOX class F420-dependent oxidoreductase [Streptomyces sp. NBC_01477]|uniref:PPOX class F420-dependent oxidoreductase n=1 Tax=Streptomyces sp. NBC_01477 TaxID=2976015 RepID=UPI002E36CDCD|nr:PPOX class F420-dependent oxidoreductase [Streptomyces sp. NBC_01477]
MTGAPTPFEPFGEFARQKTILLTTYKRDGTPVGTAVSIAVEGERAYVRTYSAAWKVRRLRNDPRVEIAPSTVKGKPTGPAVRARAVLLTGEDAARAGRALARKYPFLHGFLVPFMHRRKHWQTLHYALTVPPAE